jgi:hypothetical protein
MDETTKLIKQEWVTGHQGGNWLQTLLPLVIGVASSSNNLVVGLLVTSVLNQPVVGLAFALITHSWFRRASQPEVGRNQPLDALKGLIMLLTVIAILAVDTRHFPRHFCKTEVTGLSLMDLGVGSIVWLNGYTRSFKLRRQRKLNGAALLLVFSLVRLALTTLLNYQTHDTEYGTHWNFFITLYLVSFVENVPFPWTVLVAMHQAVLLAFQNHLVNMQRGPSLWSHNREGIVSLLGYAALFKLAQSTPHDKVGLLAWSLFLLAMLALLTQFDTPLISRRFANAPYILTVATINTFLMYVLNFITPTQLLVNISKNQLFVFIVANLSTGLVNLVLGEGILQLGWWETWFLMLAHTTFCCILAPSILSKLNR